LASLTRGRPPAGVAKREQTFRWLNFGSDGG
jgi:hypothetical protein